MASKTNTTSETNPKPILVGFLVDVSSSMKRNWKNHDGKKLPRIQVIGNILNDRIKNLITLAQQRKGEQLPVEIFCLGMGFQRLLHLSAVDVSYGRETLTGTEVIKRMQSDIVCDLIALADIVPKRSDLQELSVTINSKWNNYVEDFIQNTKIDDDIDDILKDYIISSLHGSAVKRLRWGYRYPLYKLLQQISFLQQSDSLKDLFEQLKRYFVQQEPTLLKHAEKVSETFYKNILKKTKEILDKDKDAYVEFIQTTIKDFVVNQCRQISNLAALGYPINKVVDTFDEKTIKELGLKIYTHLSQKVTENIALVWQVNIIQLIAADNPLSASIDQKRLRELTEKCIQKYSWQTLRPLIEGTIEDLFVEGFGSIAQEQISNWIGLASCREVTRSIYDVANILPDLIDGSFYSTKVMFGTTPIYDAINRASLRLLDKKYKEYEKFLVIISDGEFTSDSVITPALLLQDSGVTIITCYVKDRDIVSELMDKPGKRWPQGAKTLFKMASTADENNTLARSIRQNGLRVSNGVKFFYQINQSERLSELFDSILLQGENRKD